MVATNGHRLAKMEVPSRWRGAVERSHRATQGARADSPALPEDEELEIARGDNHLGFRAPFTPCTRGSSRVRIRTTSRSFPKDNDKYAIADKVGAHQRAQAHVGDRVGPDAPHQAVVQPGAAPVQRADAGPR